ncbi:MAG: YceI family protein [Prolixibacteraceae bacterium]|nr:YceI family protein [Prolixibacteraceae bacterium]
MPFFSFAIDKNRLKTDEECINYVLIQGSSNINQFEFVNFDPNINLSNSRTQIQGSYQNIQIPVNKFSGPNNRMLNDFFEMLKASKHPYIRIEIEPREKADFDEVTGLTNFRTKISIAGNTHTFIIPCQISFCEDSEMVLEGDLEIELSDFEIKPPKKLLGAVKVHDEVFITFAFKYDLKKT